MINRLIVTAALLGVFSAAGAARVLEQLESAAEVTLAGLTLPTSLTGTVTFRSCAECPSSTHRLNGETTFLVGNRTVTLEEFLGVANELRQNRTVSEATLVTVFLARNNARVTRLALHRGQP